MANLFGFTVGGNQVTTPEGETFGNGFGGIMDPKFREFAAQNQGGSPGARLNRSIRGLGKHFDRTSEVPDLNPANFQLQGQDERRRGLLQQADFAAGRGAPSIAGSQFRGDQRGLVDLLTARARGEGPSAAQMQLREAMGRNISGQQALMASGGSARAAQQQAGAAAGSLAGQSALLRAQEMTQAQGLLGQAVQGARGQDLQLQGMRSDAELRSRGLNDQQIARLRQMELENARLGLQGTMGLESQRTVRRGQDLGVPSGGEIVMGGLAPIAALAGK